MKKIISTLVLGLGISSGAMAIDGTINFTGTIQSNTCQINGATSLATVTVPLDAVSKTALATSGQVAGMKYFKLELSNCDGTSAKTLFSNGANVNQTTGNLKNTAVTSAATNVEVAILNSTGQAINLTNNTNSPSVTLTGTGANKTGTMEYFAQYVATGTATAGAIQASVQFSMSYQ